MIPYLNKKKINCYVCKAKNDWLGGRLTLQMIPHVMFRLFGLCFFNAVAKHLNVLSFMSGGLQFN